jgi:hypothetical protein
MDTARLMKAKQAQEPFLAKSDHRVIMFSRISRY